MMGWLRSHDRFGEWMRIGPAEGHWERGEGEPVGLALRGFYSEQPGGRVMLYRWADELRLRVGERLVGLGGCEANWSEDGGRARFRVTRGGERVLEYECEVSAALREFRDGDTPFAEAEDFDLLLMAANVLADAERRERMFRGW